MSERGIYRNYFGREAQARRVRFSVLARGVRALQEHREEIGPEATDTLSGKLIEGWAAGEISDMVIRFLDPKRIQTIFDADKEE